MSVHSFRRLAMDRSISRRSAIRGVVGGGLALTAASRPTVGHSLRTPAAATAALVPVRMPFGKFTVIAVPDGDVTFPNATFPLPPAQLLFIDAPAPERDAALRDAGFEQWVEEPQAATVTLPVLPLVVETGRHRVLMDTGYGPTSAVPTAGRLIDNLEATGISPEQIDVVVLSHLHPDHILGAVDSAGRPAFPNARYVVGRREHAFWTDEHAVAAALPDQAAREGVLTPIRAVLPAIEAHLELVDDAAEAEIVPGLRAIAAPGHTPGHLAVAIASEGKQLLATFDVFVHPLHVAHPEWNFVADALPDQAEETRRALLDRVDAEGMDILGYHFPHPGLGRISRSGETWHWEAIA